ncbi:MAG: type 3 dihydrofolate reductase [Gammaproteobacteria bacterium]
MKISIIVAMADNRVIGNDNRLPWHLPADLKHFKATTLGKPIIMGRKTWESIGRPLPGRTNIVVTRDIHYPADGCVVVHSLDAALAAAAGHDEVMVIGGAEFYRQVLPQASTLYLTLVHDEFEGDVFFPALEGGEWCEVEREDFNADVNNPHAYSFLRLERVEA